jgi:hypothetical protein
MSSTTIQVASLVKERDELNATIEKLNQASNAALSSKAITSGEQSQIFSESQRLGNESSKLDIAIINSIVNTINDGSAVQLRSSIAQLNTAIGNIKNTTNLLAKIAKVIFDTQFLIGLL